MRPRLRLFGIAAIAALMAVAPAVRALCDVACAPFDRAARAGPPASPCHATTPAAAPTFPDAPADCGHDHARDEASLVRATAVLAKDVVPLASAPAPAADLIPVVLHAVRSPVVPTDSFTPARPTPLRI